MGKFKFWLIFMLMAPLTVMTAIAPVVGAAMIAGAAALFSGMMSSKAQAEERRKQALADATNKAFETQAKAAENIGQNQQTAFQQMMEGYRSALM